MRTSLLEWEKEELDLALWHMEEEGGFTALGLFQV